ncbi:hypothetical protein ACFO1B_00005 [Dactylosporangium siamense]|uniref:Uncharacterized protein n=1 Tax=Dactylosporangium siamense TaxID=685454 RepID=A0A919PCK0_9ACTN|nr:hypothetical protein [Dactylosporangium siamense]GIG42270.1 hypothetical protein Dsi01nite_003110 [Dactylosporangium siamense]
MRYELVRRPVWVRSILSALVFAAVTTVFRLLTTPTGPLPALTAGVGGGALFGVVFGLFLYRQDRQLWGDQRLSGDERVAAVRAVDRGDPPSEPDVRTAATRVARLRTAPSNHPAAVVAMFGLLLVVALVEAAVLGNRFWWLIAGFVVVFAPWVTIRTVRQRSTARRFLAAVGNS